MDKVYLLQEFCYRHYGNCCMTDDSRISESIPDNRGEKCVHVCKIGGDYAKGINQGSEMGALIP